jgi:hypothetical protein
MEHYLYSLLFFGLSLISVFGFIVKLVLGSHRYVSAVLENDFFYDNLTDITDNLNSLDTCTLEDVNHDELIYKKAA